MPDPFQGFQGTFDENHRRNFERIDRDLIREIGELKEALAEFDSYRHVWAEMSANDVAPGRGSELAKRMEVMQGHALMLIDAAGWRLRLRIRAATHQAPMPDSLRLTPATSFFLRVLTERYRKFSGGMTMVFLVEVGRCRPN